MLKNLNTNFQPFFRVDSLKVCPKASLTTTNFKMASHLHKAGNQVNTQTCFKNILWLMLWSMPMYSIMVIMGAIFILSCFQIWWDRQRQQEQPQHQNQQQHQEEQQCRGGPRRPPPQNLLFPRFILSPHPGNLRWPILFKESFIGIKQMIIKGWNYIFSFYC